MKIKLDASIKEHREIAELFRGYECEEQGLLIGVSEERFICDIGHSYEPFSYVDIDLSDAQMDLRMAIGTDIEFRLPHYKTSRKLRTAKFDEDGKVFNFNHFFGTDAKKIKLCPDYLKSVGVEVEE